MSLSEQCASSALEGAEDPTEREAKDCTSLSLKEKARFYLRVFSYFRPELPRILGLIALTLSSIVVGLLLAWPVAVLVDLLSGNTPKDDWIHTLFLAILPSDRLGQIIGLALSLLALRLVQEGLNTGRTLLCFRVGYGGLMRVRCDLFKKLQALHVGYHKSQPQGDALYRITQDAIGFQTILNVLVSLVISVVTLAVMLVVMAGRSPRLTLLALAVAPLIFATNVRFGHALNKKCTAAKEVESELCTVIQRSMASISLMQAFGREADEADRFHSTVKSSVRAWLRLHSDEVRYTLTIGALFAVFGALIFGYGGYLVVSAQATGAKGGMTLGDLTVFLAYLGMLYDPLCKLSGASASMQGGAAGVQRVFDVLDEDPSVRDAPGAIALAQKPRVLRLERLGFSYHQGKPVLEDIDVTIKPGEMVAFVGSSGVGKSTLLNLLPRFYDPTEGALYLDEHDARNIKVADLRKHVALVLQDNVMLPTSVAENISYGLPDAPFSAIRRAAELAGAASFIERLPGGYDAPLTDGGQNLSGGQRQRIAIARALLTEAPIIVLDEPTSALDPEHEHLITETLRALKGARTIVLVSHRLSTVVDCDRIFVLDGGRVVEQGTHAELMTQRGIYQRMASRQLGGASSATSLKSSTESPTSRAGSAGSTISTTSPISSTSSTSPLSPLSPSACDI